MTILRTWCRAPKTLNPRSTKIPKNCEIHHPGLGPENTKKKFENSPNIRIFLFFCRFSGPDPGWGIFFVIFSYFWDWRVDLRFWGFVPGPQDRNDIIQNLGRLSPKVHLWKERSSTPSHSISPPLLTQLGIYSTKWKLDRLNLWSTTFKPMIYHF